MADFTAQAREDMMAWLVNAGSVTRPTVFFISFHVGDPAGLQSTAAGNESALLARVSHDDWVVGASTEGEVENDGAKETLVAGAGGDETITYFGVWSLATNGTFYFGGQLDASRNISTGDKLSWADGALTALIS